MQDLIKTYNNSSLISDWAKQNEPDKDLIYRGGVASQEQKFLAISCLMGWDIPRVVSTHTSKSVALPVAGFYNDSIRGRNEFSGRLFAAVRDNFHGLNCVIVSDYEMELDIKDIYPEVTREYLEEQKEKALKYRLGHREYDLQKIKDGCTYTEDSYKILSEVPEGNWDWYKKYAGTTIIKNSSRYYTAHTAYLGGIDQLGLGIGLSDQPYYTGPTKQFVFTSDSYAHVAMIIKKAENAVYSAAMNKSNAAYEEEQCKKNKI